MDSLGHQSLPSADLGRLDEEEASPGGGGHYSRTYPAGKFHFGLGNDHLAVLRSCMTSLLDVFLQKVHACL
ncbi:hypothetical protein TNCV_4671351 [Trichonephila clavipes]|nr:hypothetical protein TNCV_4671351 [Trichonephila clavipes]